MATIRHPAEVTSNRIAVVRKDRAEWFVTSVISDLGYEVLDYSGISELISNAGQHRHDLLAILFELDATRESDFQALHELAQTLAAVPVIVVSESAEVSVIVRVTQLGALDYVKSCEAVEFAPLIASAIRRVSRSDKAGQESSSQKLNLSDAARSADPTGKPNQAFLAISPVIRALKKTVHRFAGSDVNVLIRGESGTGKGMIASYIHSCGARADGPFIRVNCAALPEELLESELFGYEKGAFTGATSVKLGKFEHAAHGTLLLDEISETSPRMQAKLLHALQDKTFSRLGGHRDIQVDVQVLATTNRNLEREVENGKFREDLYFRLKVIDLLLPPLRERREEIPIYVDHFLALYARQYLRPAPQLSDHLCGLFMNHRWSGNIRELENMIRRIVVLGDETTIVHEMNGALEPELSKASTYPRAVAPSVNDTGRGLSLKQVGRNAARAAERQVILFALNRRGWNQKQASRDLGVSYKTLLNRMKELKLRRTDFVLTAQTEASTPNLAMIVPPWLR